MTENARVPKAVLVAGMISDSFEAERNVDRLDMVAMGFKKSAIYCGAKPCNDLYVSRQILNWMQAAIGSQCSLSGSNGVMWSFFRPRYSRRAAAFNTSWIL